MDSNNKVYIKFIRNITTVDLFKLSEVQLDFLRQFFSVLVQMTCEGNLT